MENENKILGAILTGILCVCPLQVKRNPRDPDNFRKTQKKRIIPFTMVDITKFP